MNYAETIELIANNLASSFDQVYHSAEIIVNDKGDRLPAIPKDDQWTHLVPDDRKEILYIRRAGDDEVDSELRLGTCIKSYKMRSNLRIVYFKDHAECHNEIVSKLMQAILIQNTRLRNVSRDKWKIAKDESSGDYQFGATTAYFAIDISAIWELVPEECDENYCPDFDNPLIKND